MKHRIFRLSPFLCLAGVLAAPARVLATQAHAAPEGIIGHQIAHVVFIVSMAILIYWLRERRLVEQPGWKYIQYAALFFILWNLDAFFAHLIDEQLLLVKVEKIDFWRRRIVAKNGFEGIESIYYLLKKLEGDGWIESHLEEAGRGPARKVYAVTEDGREQLRTAIVEALTTPQRCYTPLLLGIANLPAVSAAEATAALQQYVAALDAQLAHMRERWEAQKPLPYFVEAMFAYSDTLIKTERDWVEQFIKQVEANNGQG